MMHKLILLKLLTRYQDTWTTSWTYKTILTLNGMVFQIYPTKLQLNKVNFTDTEV